MTFALTDGPRGYFIFVDNAVVFLAIFANLVVLVAVAKRHFTPNSYRCLLLNLTAIDIYVCLVNLAALLYQVVPQVLLDSSDKEESNNEEDTLAANPLFKCGANVLKTLQLAGLFANLFNLCAMSVDHFLNVLFPLKYRNLFSDRIAKTLILITWLISFTLAFADIPVNLVLFSENGPANGEDDFFSEDYQTFALAKMGRNKSSLNYKISSSSAMTTTVVTLLYDDVEKPVNRSALTTQTFVFTQSSANVLDDFLEAFSNHLGGNMIARTGKPAAAAHSGPQLQTPHLSTQPMPVFHTLIPEAQVMKNHETLLNQTLNLLGESKRSARQYQQLKQSRAIPTTGAGTNTSAEYGLTTFCTFYSVKKFWFEFCVIAMVVICFVLLIFGYSVIFQRVAVRFTDISGRRTRRLILTTIIFLLSFTICRIPFVIFEFVMFVSSSQLSDFSDSEVQTIFFIQRVLYTLLVLYPLLDPIIYACRVPTVQLYLIDLVNRFLPCCRPLTQNVKIKLPISDYGPPRSVTNYYRPSLTLNGDLLAERKHSSAALLNPQQQQQQQSTNNDSVDQNNLNRKASHISEISMMPTTDKSNCTIPADSSAPVQLRLGGDDAA